MASDFTMYSGDSRQIVIAVTDETGELADLSDVQAVRFGLFNGGEGAGIIKSLDDGITVGTGTVTVTLEPADTEGMRGEYVHETEIVDALGAVHTVLQGRASIARDYLT